MGRIKSGFYLDLREPKETKLVPGDTIRFELGTVQFSRGGTRLLYGSEPEKDNKFVLQIDKSEIFVFTKIIATAMGMNVNRLVDSEDLVVYEFV